MCGGRDGMGWDGMGCEVERNEVAPAEEKWAWQCLARSMYLPSVLTKCTYSVYLLNVLTKYTY